MKSSTILALLTTAVVGAIAEGYTIPLDVSKLPQGESTISFDANGNTVVTSEHSSLTSRSRTGGSVLDKRDGFPGSVDIGCAGLFLEGGPEHGAWQQGVDWCNKGNQIGGHSIKTWVDGVSCL